MLDCDSDLDLDVVVVVVAAAAAAVVASAAAPGFAVVSWWCQDQVLASASSYTGSRTRCRATATKSN